MTRPWIASRRLRRSSTAHCVITPGAPRLRADQQRHGVERRVARRRRRSSRISAKPRSAASAASAASSAGFSLRFVTCAWLAGARRARRRLSANIISTGSSRPTTRASLAGVSPRASRTSSERGTSTSTSRRASAASASAIASGATSRSMPCAAMKRSSVSKRSRGLPSSSLTTPSVITSEGSGSPGPFMATRPSEGSGRISVSRRSGALGAHAEALAARLVAHAVAPQQAALGEHDGRLAHEGGAARRAELAPRWRAIVSSSSAVARRGRSAV